MRCFSISGSAGLVATILAISNSAHSQSVTLASLVSGSGTVTSGNLLFSDFTDSSSGTLSVDPSQIYVTVSSGGITFQCSSWNMFGSSQSYNLSVSFDLATTDSTFLDGLASSLVGSTSGQAQSILSETLTSGVTSVGNSAVYLDVAYTGHTKTSDSISFTPESSLSVNKNFSMATSASDSTAFVTIGSFSQNFATVVPEPSTLAMGIMGGFGGLSLLLLRRRK